MQFSADLQPEFGQQLLTSDEDGRFEFLAVDEPALTVAVHDLGYAELTADELTASGEIRLRQWARLEATIHAGENELDNIGVNVHSNGPLGRRPRDAGWRLSKTTGDSGRVTFVFDRVPPVDATICRTVRQELIRGSTVYMERHTQVTLTPGETSRIEIGGDGVPVRGRLHVPGDPPKRHSWLRNQPVFITPVSTEAVPRNRTRYIGLINKDGEFLVEDVPPGEYRLSVTLTAEQEPNSLGPGERIGRIGARFEIAGDDEAVDLGVIEGAWGDGQ